MELESKSESESESESKVYTFSNVELLNLLDDLRHIAVTSVSINGRKNFDIYITVLRRGKLISIPYHKKKEKDMKVLDKQGTGKLLTKVDTVISNKGYTEYKKEFPSYFNDVLNSNEDAYTKELSVLLEETQKVMEILLSLVKSFEVMHNHINFEEFEKGKILLDESYLYYLDNWDDYFTRYEIGVHYVSTRQPITRYLKENNTVNYKELVLKDFDNNLLIQLSYLHEIKEELLKSIHKALKLNLDLYKIYQKTGRMQKVSDVSELLDVGCGKELMCVILRLGVLEEIYHTDAYLVKMRKEYSKVLSDDYSEVYINQFN